MINVKLRQVNKQALCTILYKLLKQFVLLVLGHHYNKYQYYDKELNTLVKKEGAIT